MPKFCVPVYYMAVANFIVDAESESDAESIAVERFQNGEPPNKPEVEREVDRVGCIEKIGD
jgi:hypothetical protein